MTETTRPYPRVVKDFKGVESRTHQSFKDEVNINTIVQKWLRTGEPPINPGGVAQYGDSTAFTSYHDALNTVAAANELFSSLPSRVRERMKNSPAGSYASWRTPTTSTRRSSWASWPATSNSS